MGALVAVAGLALPSSTAEAQLFSPGALSRDHRSIDGDANCARCHESGRRVSDRLCNECHQTVGRSVRAGTGLHGHQYRNQSCGGCHVEHRGAGGTLVRWPGGSRDGFDHDLVGWALRGAHREQRCDGCHTARNSRGARTYFGTRTACRSCHEDPHDGRLGTSCQSCHSETRWSAIDVDDFDHGRTRFPLRGAHRQVTCGPCHGTPARYTGLRFGQCSDCHHDPHSGRYGADCAGCHTEAGWSELGAIRQNHPGLRLSGGHTDTGCTECHDRGVDTAPSRGRACVSCHRPVHEANLGNNCASCHGAIRWMGLPRRIGLRAHTRTEFPLLGQHQETNCAECHPRDQPRQRRYRELSFEGCTSCHSDRHEGEFAARDGGECSGCHNENGFAPTTFTPVAHASTSFPLEGLHSLVACSACHSGDRPRLDWHATGSRCADCHENPHGDQFASEMAQGGCAQCHTAAGWDRPNIDHSTWPLDGAHGLIRCDSCHSPSDEDRQTGRGASYRGVPRECSGCHEDEHAGQFRLSAPERECTVCHDTASFEVRPFDHEGVTGYGLVGRHADAECRACHAPERLRDGTRVTRWRLGYRECRDCHADPHAAPSGASGGSR